MPLLHSDTATAVPTGITMTALVHPPEANRPQLAIDVALPQHKEAYIVMENVPTDDVFDRHADAPCSSPRPAFQAAELEPGEIYSPTPTTRPAHAGSAKDILNPHPEDTAHVVNPSHAENYWLVGHNFQPAELEHGERYIDHDVPMDDWADLRLFYSDSPIPRATQPAVQQHGDPSVDRDVPMEDCPDLHRGAGGDVLKNQVSNADDSPSQDIGAAEYSAAEVFALEDEQQAADRSRNTEALAGAQADSPHAEGVGGGGDEDDNGDGHKDQVLNPHDASDPDQGAATTSNTKADTEDDTEDDTDNDADQDTHDDTGEDTDVDTDEDPAHSQADPLHAEGAAGGGDGDEKTKAADDSDNDSVDDPSKNDGDVEMGPPSLLTDSPSPPPSPSNLPATPTPSRCRNLPWISVDADYQIPTLNDLDSLKAAYADLQQQLDPAAEYPIFSQDIYRDSVTDALQLEQMTSNQALATEQGVKIPLAFSRASLAGPTSKAPDGERISKVWIVSEKKWLATPAHLQQEVLRTRGVQILHPVPHASPSGQRYSFDLESMSSFTNSERFAWIQSEPPIPWSNGISDFGLDLGLWNARTNADFTQVGRPSDLLACTVREDARHTAGSPPEQGQALNLLANVLEETTLTVPLAWDRIATHEFVTRFLRGLSGLARFRFLWGEVNWAIFATQGAMTWLHLDVLLTVVMLACGSKFWALARRRDNLPMTELRGVIHSRSACDKFNGWTAMMDVYEYEILHLTPNSTLIMPATMLHWVMTEAHSIATGRHGIAHSNITNSITTNADHEPVRQLLLRIFIFIGAVLMYPTDPKLGRGDAGHPASTAPFTIPGNGPPAPPRPHPERRASALPINDQLWQDVELSWRFAAELDQYINEHYLVVENPQASHLNSKPATFADAAEHALLIMAASLIRYRSSVPTKHPKVDVPFGFTPRRFKAQIANVPIVKALDDMLASDKSWEYLLPWDANSIPFALQVVTKDT
ncbi:hypothetical protein B0H14DRAFT_2632165 [Mycena olivaceomarginata]|nr:hypothetical protein B0H14DRAFT_2632165 [Mycena olivaceomarginata]